MKQKYPKITCNVLSGSHQLQQQWVLRLLRVFLLYGGRAEAGRTVRQREVLPSCYGIQTHATESLTNNLDQKYVRRKFTGCVCLCFFCRITAPPSGRRWNSVWTTSFSLSRPTLADSGEFIPFLLLSLSWSTLCLRPSFIRLLPLILDALFMLCLFPAEHAHTSVNASLMCGRFFFQERATRYNIEQQMSRL